MYNKLITRKENPMKGSIGVSGSITHIIPHIERIDTHELSTEAKKRLKIIEWHENTSYKYSKNNKKNVALTCRHFGIARSYFYKWYNRFDPNHLSSLESKSTRPKNSRVSTIDYKFIELVKYLRKQYPHYSAKKLYYIIKREYPNLDNHYSPATIGRLIKKYNLYFRLDTIKHKKNQRKQ
jgi:transposase